MNTRRGAFGALSSACVLAVATATSAQAADHDASASTAPSATPTKTPAEAPTEAPTKTPAEAPTEAPKEAPAKANAIVRPPPFHLEYVQYGLAIVFENNINAGAVCSSAGNAPCILGGAGGLAFRGGYRSAGPWYIGGAYQFAKMDSSNLYRLGIFQQLRVEMRYLPDLGTRTAPYGSWGIGALAYGNEWGVETGGGLLFGGLGVEVELSRTALIGFGAVYRAMLIAGWTDTAGTIRETGVAQFWGAEFQFELRSEIKRK